MSKIISVFLAGMYLFVVLFSSQLHNHKIEIDKSLSLGKTESVFSKANSHYQNPADCFSCHFLANHHVLLPEEFVFQAHQHNYETQQIFFVQETIWDNSKPNYQLRGPPSFS